MSFICPLNLRKVREKQDNCFFAKCFELAYLRCLRQFKKTSEKIKGVPKITGLKYEKLSLYKKIQTKDTKALNALLKVINSAKEYDFDIKRIDVSEEQEVTMYNKKLQVQLGKATNIERKLLKFNEFYDKAIGYEGVLNMKRLSPDGNYTLEQPTKEEKNKKKQ